MEDLEKLQEAIKMIKAECVKHHTCGDCPMCKPKIIECGLGGLPNSWKITDPKIFISITE